MSFAPVHPRVHNERGLARMRRSPQVGVSSAESATSTPSGSVQTSSTSGQQVVNTNLPVSVKALAGFIVVLGVIVLGIAIWKIWAWRIRKIKGGTSNSTNEKGSHDERLYGTSSISIDLESARTEQPSKAHLAPAVPVVPYTHGTGWVPQIRLDLALPEPTKPRSQQVKKTWEKNLAKLMGPNSNGSDPISPPPSYYIANQSTTPLRDNLPVPPVPVSPVSQPPPPTPAALKLNFEGIAPPPSKLVPSPTRDSSFGPHPVVNSKLNSSRHSEKKFPRLMSVVSSFEPSMEDELWITVGETIRILEEYEDEWCLIQRVGRIDAEKGVVPRHCLMERPEVIPTHPRLPSVGSNRW